MSKKQPQKPKKCKNEQQHTKLIYGGNYLENDFCKIAKKMINFIAFYVESPKQNSVSMRIVWKMVILKIFENKEIQNG